MFARVLGRRMTIRRLPIFMVRMSMGKEWAQMFRWLDKYGFQADILALRRDYPEVTLTSLEEWLIREGWQGKSKVIVKRDSMGRPLAAA